MRYAYLIPAYGRWYKTKEEVLKDWEEGKDFKILHGPYTSIRDTEHFAHITIVSWGDKWKKIEIK